MRPRFLQTKKTLAYRTVGMYHGPNSWGDGTGLGCSIVLYCMTTLCTYLIRTRWGVSDLLHYQAYCNKARREREREREETGEGKAGARAFGDVSGPTFSDRACVHGQAWGRLFSWYAPVCSPWDGCIRRFLTSTHVARTAC